MKARKFTKQLFWAYYDPKGNIQTRSIQPSRKLCREAIAFREYTPNGDKVTYSDYEAAGYTLHRVVATIHPIEQKA